MGFLLIRTRSVPQGCASTLGQGDCLPCFCLKKRTDTVGELKSAEIFASHMPSWKAKKLGEAYSRNLSLGASKPGRLRARSFRPFLPAPLRTGLDTCRIIRLSGFLVSLTLAYCLPRSWIMLRIVSAVRISRTLTSFPWETCFPSPVGFFFLSFVPVETAFPSADYYGSSVALGLAPRRQSRALLLPYVVAWGRWPVRSVVRVHYPLSCPRRWV